MLDIILQILSIIGIVLLVLLVVVLVVLLLILFFPITYKFYGAKTDGIAIRLKVKWLLGFFRVSYEYPESAILDVKVLWHSLYQKKIPQDSSETEDELAAKNDTDKAEPNLSKQKEAKTSQQNTAVPSVTDTDCDVTAQDATNMAEEEFSQNKILKKIEKIKYTISNIYDKIKEIWENITYYIELLKEENTKLLFQHVIMRVGRMLKNIRPRHLKADIVFGTGSPDTTGYVYGIYGMLTAVLGPKFILEPDFEQAVLKGELQFSGHITVWILILNVLKLVFDPKLHLFIKKIKAGLPKKENSNV